MTRWPFDPDIPMNTWMQVSADGFRGPVAGCVYEGTSLDGGVPLGGLGTGYLTLEGTGKIGTCSIFNDIVPPRKVFKDWLTVRRGGVNELPLSTARIAYWGHYPMADLVATFPTEPVCIGIRAFTPFLPGNSTDSNIPAVLFELEVTNTGDNETELTVEVAPPAAGEDASGETALVGNDFEVATDAGAPVGRWQGNLAAGESRRLRFAFGWYFPHWRDSGREPHVHRYGARFDSAESVGLDAMRRFDDLLRRILAWQQVIYDADLPAWLQDALVQGFYSLAKNSVWIARTRHDEWWGADGWFTHSESHTGCPITETMVCRMHGHFPTLLFFPDLEESALEAFKHFQISDGEVPFSYGVGTSMRDPRYHCQHPLNSGQYAQMVYRLYLRTEDEDLLRRFYESAKSAIRYQFSLDDDDDGLVNDQAHTRPGEHWPANQFYDIWPWWGTSAYVAGTWLATLRCGTAMAEQVGDTTFAAECADWLSRAQKAYQQKLWTGKYYRLWSDLKNDQRSDVSLGNQLMAQWCTKLVELDDVLPDDNVQSALDFIQRLNMAATDHGLVNGMTPEGEPFDAGRGVGDHARNTFVGESLCAAMTFMYHGRDEVGLQIARRVYEAIALTSRSPWNQRCLIDSRTGLPVWGDDYYSDMVVWALPMAVKKTGITDAAKPDGLVGRMIDSAGSG